MDVFKKASREYRKKAEKRISVKDKLPPITCKCGCGNVFIPKSRKQHFFNEQHREDYYNRTYYLKESVEKVCPNCGETFKTTCSGKQTYCKPECRDEARIKRRGGQIIDAQSRKKEFYTDRYKQLSADGFACRLCGKAARDGVKLDVEEDRKGGKMTICNQCSEGRKSHES